MRKHRFFTPDDLAINNIYTLNEDISHHIIKVLRLEIGSLIFLFNNTGYELTARITDIHKKNVTVQIEKHTENQTESPLHINLAQGLGKGDKLEFVIQKATELGVNTIIPLFSERSIVKNFADKSAAKLEHWQKIAISAACQSWRNYVPKILAPSSLNAWLESQQGKNNLILSPHASAKHLRDLKLSGNITMLIGPEGGFSDTELELAISKNFIPVSLGPRILRTETAGIAAIAILQAMYGDC